MNYKELDELVANAKEGDIVAIEELLSSYKFFIIKHASRVYINGYEMDDLIQIGYMSIIKAIEKYTPGKGNFTSYVTFAIKNNFNYLIRQKTNENFIQSLETPVSSGLELKDLLPDKTSIEDDYVTKEGCEILRKEVENLSEKLRDVIEFVYLDNFGTLSDYARLNNIGYNTVIKRKNLALSKLNTILKI
ncbi:sigma-70 family RNA polymerase sigma factor [Clostridium sp.]|uniref:sigma-70 family RNA polymerase sigma factor n=1 Tax=Clostridium sp. TaxID=1506 RepID=UPI003216A879